MSETERAELTFEKAIERLGEIVESLEKGDLPLERSLALFEEGVLLSRLGQERLDRAEARVDQLLANQTTKPLALERAAAADKKNGPTESGLAAEKKNGPTESGLAAEKKNGPTTSGLAADKNDRSPEASALKEPR